MYVDRQTGMNRRRFIWKCGLALGGFLAGRRRLAEASDGMASLWGTARRPQIALIIDDIGQSRTRAREFMKMDIALTFSILPHLPYSCELAEEMNSMAAQLDEKLKTVVNQRNELEAVLSSMVEGVIAFDEEDRIITINSAAADLLRIDPDKAAGQSVQETIRKLY